MSDKAMLRQALDEYKQVKQEGEECFVLFSKKHTRMKYDLKRLFQNPFHLARIAEAFAAMFARSSLARIITVFVGPESVNPFLVKLQRYYTFKETRIALVKKDGSGGFFLDDSIDLYLSDCCLLIDDVLTTGKTLCGIRKAVLNWKYVGLAHGRYPDIAGSAVIVNRVPEHGALVPYVPEPLVSLLYDHEYPVYAPDQCPFCRH